MLIERTTKRIETFNLDDTDEKRELESIMNNPKVRIVRKKEFTKTFGSGDGDSSETHTEQHCLVEWEECGL